MAKKNIWTVENIKAAVDAGMNVYWKNDQYKVIKDKLGRYLIAYDLGGDRENFVGLTWKDGTTLNGKSDDFFGGYSREAAAAYSRRDPRSVI